MSRLCLVSISRKLAAASDAISNVGSWRYSNIRGNSGEKSRRRHRGSYRAISRSIVPYARTAETSAGSGPSPVDCEWHSSLATRIVRRDSAEAARWSRRGRRSSGAKGWRTSALNSVAATLRVSSGVWGGGRQRVHERGISPSPSRARAGRRVGVRAVLAERGRASLPGTSRSSPDTEAVDDEREVGRRQTKSGGSAAWHRDETRGERRHGAKSAAERSTFSSRRRP